MLAREAFRILIGSLSGDRDVYSDHHKVNSLCKAVMNLLDPLRIHSRLHFFKAVDERGEKEWLIIKIETSSQVALPFNTPSALSEQEELTRECGVALDLMQSALSALRELELASRMTPHRFWEIYKSQEKTIKSGLILAKLTEAENPQVLLRSPEGRDSFALFPSGSVYQTKPGAERWHFKVHGVRRHYAYIRRTDGAAPSAKPYGKELPLFWGGCANRSDLANQYFSAMEGGTTMTALIRPTLNGQGVLKRLEWCEG